MSFVHRAVKYLYRKKARSFLLLLLMMAISLGILGTVSIQKATEISGQTMKKSLNTHFTLTPNPGVSWGIGSRGFGSRGFGDLPESHLKKIAATEGIRDYQMTLVGEASLPGMKKKELNNPQVQYSQEQESILKEHYDFEGHRKSELDQKFISGLLKLEEGRHLNEKDNHKIMVHEDFAKINGLKLHDTLSFKSSPVNEFTQIEDGEVEIIGIFSGSNKEKATHYTELFENMILSDLQTSQALRAYENTEAMYDAANFFVEEPEQMEKVMHKVRSLDLPWEKYQLSQAEQNYAGMLTSLSSMNQIIRQMFIGVLYVSIAVLSLVLWFWIQARIHETGILLSVGLSKLNILGQYLVEVWIVASLALLLSLPMSHQISQRLSQTVVKQAQAKTEEVQRQELGGLNMGQDANSSVMSQTIEDLDVRISEKELIKVIGLGSLVIVFSVGSASMYLVRMKPKEILSKMS